MITSALIARLRRKYDDQPKAAQVIREGDGSSTLFNVGRNRVPVMETGYSVYKGTSAQTETSHYTLDKDTGDVQFVSAVVSGVNAKINFKHANFRDQHWVDAINDSIDRLNARGYSRQTVWDTSSFTLSANQQVYNAPTNAIDVYQLLINDGAGNYGEVGAGNWSYNGDRNKIILGYQPSSAASAAVSYLRKLKTYEATSATLDIKDEWATAIEKGAGAYYFRKMASKIATQGNASVQEGHFSFTSLRTQANDLDNEFERESTRMKPAGPPKTIRFGIPQSGPT